ncbi:MAG: hypothetical protein GX605_07155 [Chloroflexi bacterium]|nr:hypothetical protein [Chloroflexota bacterium]
MPEQNTNGQQGDGQQQDAGGGTPQGFEAWLAGQDEATQKLYNEHVTGLKGALQAERNQRKAETADLVKQLREATKQAEEGSAARKALEEATARLEGAELRSQFYEEAVRPEIGCANPRLAFLAAQEIGAMDGKGRVNWDVLKAQFPELFRGKASAAGQAGAGTGAPPTGKADMNTWIRRAAGR